MNKPDMPEDSLLSGLKGDLYKSDYKDDMQVLGQCDTAMQAKLQVTEDWETNKMDLLFVLKQAAQAACIGVQENYSMYVVGGEAFRS